MAGSGKTQYVKSLSSEYSWKLFMVNHKEGLRDLTDDHDGFPRFFLDDVSLDGLDELTLLSLIETCDKN